MLVVTTPTISGYRIVKHLGIVSGEAILGANIFRDFFAGIRDIVGGRSAAYEKELRNAKAIALTLQVGSGGGMLMVSASGMSSSSRASRGYFFAHEVGGTGAAFPDRRRTASSFTTRARRVQAARNVKTGSSAGQRKRAGIPVVPIPRET